MSQRPFVCIVDATEYIEKMKFCLTCGRFNTIYPATFRPVESLWGGEVVVQASDFIKDTKLSMLAPYPIPVGRRFVAALYGSPGAGKTTMGIRIGDAFEGTVLYVAVEQGLADSLKARLRSLEVCRDGFLIGVLRDVTSIDRVVSERGVGLVLLDSITASSLRTNDLVAFSIDRNVSVVMTAQVNKEGMAAGDMGILHGADLVVRVEKMRWEIEKSRFGGLTSGEVL